MEALNHIRNISKKKITTDCIFAQLNNATATNWDLQSVRACLNAKHVNGWQLSKPVKNDKTSVLSFFGASSKQMMTYIKPTIEQKPDFIILHTGNNLRSNANPEEIANSIVDVASLARKMV